MFPGLTKIPRHSCNILKFPDWNSSGSVSENPVPFLQKNLWCTFRHSFGDEHRFD